MSKEDSKLIARVDEHLKRQETFKGTDADPLDDLAKILMDGRQSLVLGNFAAAIEAFNVALDEVAKMQDGEQ